jgi:hypothetical protein
LILFFLIIAENVKASVWRILRRSSSQSSFIRSGFAIKARFKFISFIAFPQTSDSSCSQFLIQLRLINLHFSSPQVQLENNFLSRIGMEATFTGETNSRDFTVPLLSASKVL